MSGAMMCAPALMTSKTETETEAETDCEADCELQIESRKALGRLERPCRVW